MRWRSHQEQPTTLLSALVAVLYGLAMTLAHGISTNQTRTNTVIPWSLYTVPSCAVASTFSIDNSFCTEYMPQNIVVNGTSVEEQLAALQILDNHAKSIYEKFDAILSTYDCRLDYGAGSCTACQEAYQAWLCAAYFVGCSAELVNTACDDSGCDLLQSAKLCPSLCQKVIKACPYVIGFSCPSGDEDDAFFSTGSYSTGTCE